MDHPKDHSLFGLGLPGYTHNKSTCTMPSVRVCAYAKHVYHSEVVPTLQKTLHNGRKGQE